MINNQEYLFIFEQDKIEDTDTIRQEIWIRDDNSINLDYWDEAVYDQQEVKIIRTFADKLPYVYACWYNDADIEEIIRKYFPEVTKITVPSCRSHKGNNLHEWSKKYNFTLEDFLINEKFVIVCDSYDAVDNLIQLGLFNWDNIKDSSILED